MKSQIRLDMTADGLRIQIVDENQRPMFSSGSAVVALHARAAAEIGTVLAEVPNRLTLEGHTDAAPFVGGGFGYSNWELSADRANASRRELMSGGLPEDRMLRVQGLAASLPFDAKDRRGAANRRISIIVMNREAEDRIFRRAAARRPRRWRAPQAAAKPIAAGTGWLPRTCRAEVGVLVAGPRTATRSTAFWGTRHSCNT